MADVSIVIRRATPEDARAITEVRIETWRATYTGILDPAFLASQTIEEGATRLRSILVEEAGSPEPKPFRLVATRDDKVVGFAICRAKPNEPFEGEWFLNALYIHPSAQGLGIGAKMVALAKEEGRRRGAARMVLPVYSANTAAQTFYRATSAVHLGPHEFEVGGKAYPVELFAYTIADEPESVTSEGDRLDRLGAKS